MWTSHYEKRPVVPACVEVIFEMSFVRLFGWLVLGPTGQHSGLIFGSASGDQGIIWGAEY